MDAALLGLPGLGFGVAGVTVLLSYRRGVGGCRTGSGSVQTAAICAGARSWELGIPKKKENGKLKKTLGV